ncbi:MAG: ABC transporter permease [Gemmatimonadetes bacterium]|nr:ABC transporter permease [Gemmatimonadota bacterium]NIQ53029.1 ABC transporter permease [Gemmatimonadota bacterium]NIU73173.1 ABC transporter permease [Gammaproteobacteria bacterium]NIX43467.1 ABC transporter permease [Gemmatimonadota bacterium]NIY07641.1 ABC transporter permease [Gemmatimonadota bacterium]
MSWTRLRAMARKEWIQLRRDPRSMTLAFVLPVLLLLFFGYAITWDVKDLDLVVLDGDRTGRSRSLIEAFEASGYFTVVDRLDSYRRVAAAVGRGNAGSVLVIPPGFAEELAAGRGAPVQLLLDGADANSATIAFNYADAIVDRWSRDVVLQGRRVTVPIEAEVRTWYNPTLESRNMIVPGLIAVIMMTIAAMLTALTIAREWERGTMEQLASTPATKLEILIGKLIPYVVIGVADVAMIAVAGILVFGVPFRGPVVVFLAQTILFLVGALGLGMVISAAARTQFLATQIALIATLLPAMLLSGFLFEIEAMPEVLQAVTYLVPARYYVVVARGIMLKGVGPSVLWIQSVFMVAFAVLGLGLATRVFRREVA